MMQPHTSSTTSHVAIHNEKLDDALKDYVGILAERYPFSVDLRVDEQIVIPRLAEFWPEDSEWSAQAYELWERIGGMVQSITTQTKTPNVRLHLAATTSPMSPIELPEPNAPAALAAYDSISGMLLQCNLPATQEALPSLKNLAIPRGLMVVCQPLVEATNERINDDRANGFGVGTNIYSDRNRDSVPPPHEGQLTEKVKAENKEEKPPTQSVEAPRPQPL